MSAKFRNCTLKYEIVRKNPKTQNFKFKNLFKLNLNNVNRLNSYLNTSYANQDKSLAFIDKRTNFCEIIKYSILFFYYFYPNYIFYVILKILDIKAMCYLSIIGISVLTHMDCGFTTQKLPKTVRKNSCFFFRDPKKSTNYHTSFVVLPHIRCSYNTQK